MSFPAYRHYKGSDVDWLGTVPSHWAVTAIKHIVTTPVTDGPHETPDFIDEGIPFVSAEAVSSGEVDFTRIRGFISQADHDRYCRKYKPQIDDIYVVKSGASTGTTAIVADDREFSIWSPLAAIRCGEDFDPRFILNFLRSQNFQEGVKLSWSFGTQQNIGMNVIENMQVARPPLDEQTAIATFLHRETAKIDALVAEQRRLIELLKEKRQAVISHAVTKGLDPTVPMKDSGIEWLGEVPEHWDTLPMKCLVDLKSGDAITADRIDDRGDYPVYGGNGMRGYTSGFTHDGDYVLVGRQGALCGNVNFATGKFWASEHAVVASPLRELDTKWLGEMVRAMNLGQYSISAAQPGLSMEIVGAVRTAVPPTDEQEKIAQYVCVQEDRLGSLMAESEQAISLLQERRNALISAAVTGKIDVREHAMQETA